MPEDTLSPAAVYTDLTEYEALDLPFYVPTEYRVLLTPIGELYQDPANLNIHDDKNLDAIEASLRAFGFMEAVKAAPDGRVVVGNGRLQVAKRMGATHVPMIRTEHLSELDALRYAISDNRTSDLSYFDEPALARTLSEFELDLLPPGFDQMDLDQILADNPLPVNDGDPHSGFGGVTSGSGDLSHFAGSLPDEKRLTLKERFGVPPFSVLDARQGYWQSRKRAWLSLGIKSEVGRGSVLLYGDSAAVIEGGLNHYRNAEKDKAQALIAEGIEQACRTGKAEIIVDGKEARLLIDDTRRMEDARSGMDESGTIEETADGSLIVKKTENGLVWGNQKGLNAIMGQRTGKKPNTGGLLNQKHIHAYDGTDGGDVSMCGTSIFDPVLCELAVRWFSGPNHSVLDVFAGGSVRGVVTAMLGRYYTGIDLRPEQINANVAQWKEIGPRVLPAADMVVVKVSAAMARLPFNGCDPDYIRDVCHASCCQSSSSPTGTLITINSREQAQIERRGAVVKDGLLQPRPGEKKCPFKNEVDLCGLHFTPDKPFGCIASPFTLNDLDTLIVRNRYKMLKCYNDGPQLPAYVAFRASLDLIFGPEEAQRLHDHFEAGGGDIDAAMPKENWKRLHENDLIKHGDQSAVVDAPPSAGGRDLAAERPDPRWICGDAMDAATLAPGQHDMLFTCPPYGDLEVYSDDPRDISNMGYKEFKPAYHEIIGRACKQLKDDRFAVIVVGDFRDKRGMYNNFVSDTIQAFLDGGLELYNEMILVTVAGSLPIRAGRQMDIARKVGKSHQNVLVFVKGDPKKATAACGLVEYGDLGLDGEAAEDEEDVAEDGQAPPAEPQEEDDPFSEE